LREVRGARFREMIFLSSRPLSRENLLMAQAKQTSRRKRRINALPVMGLAGASLSLAGGAQAAAVPAADLPPQNLAPSQITLGEEEISDVSLSTFYVFDKENSAKAQPGQQLAQWRCRCGCRGCGRCGCGWRGCGCGGCGCGRCCISWGLCRWAC